MHRPFVLSCCVELDLMLRNNVYSIPHNFLAVFCATFLEESISHFHHFSTKINPLSLSLSIPQPIDSLAEAAVVLDSSSR